MDENEKKTHKDINWFSELLLYKPVDFLRLKLWGIFPKEFCEPTCSDTDCHASSTTLSDTRKSTLELWMPHWKEKTSRLGKFRNKT